MSVSEPDLPGHRDLSMLSIPLSVYLTLLGAGLGYAVYQDGGVGLSDWNVTLLLIGTAAIVLFFRAPTADLAPRFERWLGWTALLFPAYVAFQLVPLPLFLLRILSPVRAEAIMSLSPVAAAPSFAALSIDPANTFVHLFRIIGYALIFLVIREITWRSSQRWIWAPAMPLVVIAAVEAAFGLAQNAGGTVAQGTYANRNHFAGLMEMVLPLAIMYAIAVLKRDESRRQLSTVAAIKACGLLILATLIFLGLLYSLSRMGVIGGLVGLFGIGALALSRVDVRPWIKWVAVAGLAVFILAVFIFLPPDELIKRFGDALTQDGKSAEGRWPIWLDTLRLIGAYPIFGCGLGNYETAFLRYQTALVDLAFTFAHNDYLELLSELGSVGFAILAVLMAALLRRSLRAARQGSDSAARYLGLGCVGSAIAIGLHSLADFNMYIPSNALLLAWIFGIAAGIPLHPLPESQRSWASPRRTLAKKAALVFSGLLLVYIPVWMLFTTAFQSYASAERLFCRFGICDTDAVLTAQQLTHGSVAAIPIPELEVALRRDPAAPNRWCDLGDAMWKAGRRNPAEYCFSRALSLGPEVPQVLLRAADFYYGVRQDSRAMQQTSHVLHITPSYDSSIFNGYRERKLGPSAVLPAGVPAGPRAPQAYLRYLMETYNSADSEKAWDWLMSKGYVDLPLAREYLDFLFRSEKYETAAQAWARFLGESRNGYLVSDWLFNGDFEHELSNTAFDWRIENPQGAEAALDEGVAHTGRHSLRIRFRGTDNVTYNHVTEIAFVKPGKYRFEAYVRTQDITTDQGVGFRIYDREGTSRLDLKTETFAGTNDWKKVEQTFCVPRGARLLVVQAVRQPSWKFDNKIGGTAWIDSAKLLGLNQACPDRVAPVAQ